MPSTAWMSASGNSSSTITTTGGLSFGAAWAGAVAGAGDRERGQRREKDVTHSMCGVCGNMSTGVTGPIS